MRGVGYADVLPVLQVPDNKADAVPCKRLQKNRAAGCLPRSPDEPLSQLYFIDLLQSKDTFESRKHRIGIKSDQGYDQSINCQ